MKTRIAGIPCEARATRIVDVKGNYSHSASCPEEYHGYIEVDFDVFDRKGYPATWLEEKMTEDERRRIERELVEEARAEGAEDFTTST
jgi:hypothetical protein